MVGPEGVERSLLIAAFETRRSLYLMAFLQHREHANVALAYAWNERIYPFYHRTLEREVHGVDCFSDLYTAKENEVTELIEYLNERCLAANEGQPVTGVEFYELETKFGKRIGRAGLIDCIRYCFLAAAFDDDLYKAIEAHAPMEAHRLMTDFGPDEVEL